MAKLKKKPARRLCLHIVVSDLNGAQLTCLTAKLETFTWMSLPYQQVDISCYFTYDSKHAIEVIHHSLWFGFGPRADHSQKPQFAGSRIPRLLQVDRAFGG